MLLAKAPYLNLDLTIESGQVFLWNKLGDCWYGIEGSNVVKISAGNHGLEYFSYPASIDLKKFFRLEDDLYNISKKISKDPIIEDALSKMKGLRIMRQNPYQCLISFICATNTNISMIKQMLTKISINFGKKLVYDKFDFYTFPEPKRLAKAGITELCRCSVGYRARFIKRAAKAVLDGEIDFDHLKHRNYENAKNELMDILGIGNKVADCILLFSLEKLDSFPIDIWIARAIMKYYSHMFKKEFDYEKIAPSVYRTISLRMREYFGEYAGYAQQYLYCYGRNNKS